MKKFKAMILACSLATFGLVGVSAAPASASPCEPGDPNCNVGCEIINRIFKDSCQT